MMEKVPSLRSLLSDPDGHRVQGQGHERDLPTTWRAEEKARAVLAMLPQIQGT